MDTAERTFKFLRLRMKITFSKTIQLIRHFKLKSGAKIGDYHL